MPRWWKSKNRKPELIEFSWGDPVMNPWKCYFGWESGAVEKVILYPRSPGVRGIPLLPMEVRVNQVPASLVE